MNNVHTFEEVADKFYLDQDTKLTLIVLRKNDNLSMKINCEFALLNGNTKKINQLNHFESSFGFLKGYRFERAYQVGEVKVIVIKEPKCMTLFDDYPIKSLVNTNLVLL